ALNPFFDPAVDLLTLTLEIDEEGPIPDSEDCWWCNYSTNADRSLEWIQVDVPDFLGREVRGFDFTHSALRIFPSVLETPEISVSLTTRFAAQLDPLGNELPALLEGLCTFSNSNDTQPCTLSGFVEGKPTVWHPYGW